MSNTFTPLAYDRDWNNEIDFPTYVDNETVVRADMQYLFDAIRNYINGNGETGNGLLEEIAAALAAAVAGDIPDGSVTTSKLAADAVIYAAGKLAMARAVNIASSDGTNPGNSVAFDGTADKTLLLPSTIKAALIGNASTADKLKTARNIGSASFDGSAAISLAQMGAAAVGASYTKAEADARLSGKADVSSTTSALALKANIADVYDKDDADALLLVKADLNGDGKIDAEEASAAIWLLTNQTDYTFNPAQDAGCLLRVQSEADVTMTIPATGFPVGTEIEIVKETSSAVTIKGAEGVTLITVGMPALAEGQTYADLAGYSVTLPELYGTCVLKQVEDDVWLVGGSAEAVAPEPEASA